MMPATATATTTPAAAPAEPMPADRVAHAPAASAGRSRSAQVVAEAEFSRDEFFHRFAPMSRSIAGMDDACADRTDHAAGRMVDYLFVTPDQPHTPDDVFARLRWGGQVVFMSSRQSDVVEAARRFAGRCGFVIEQGPTAARRSWMGLSLPWVCPRVHYFIARRIALIPPGQFTDRFTFNVRLARDPKRSGRYVVVKQMPTYTSVMQRLASKFPEADAELLEKRARKLVDRVFPIFLTRETAFLTLLQRGLPPSHRDRVPQALAVQKGPDGLVQKFHMNWLRLGGVPMSQLEFARQSAELLSILHDRLGVMHLDLRLDNFVITPAGVGFVDFGSAVRVDEKLHESPLLRSLFDEMMATSKIQRTIGRMADAGSLTSSLFLHAYQKVDKAVDLFYLALQMNRPHFNPDFRALVQYDPRSRDARRIAKLTDAILRPIDPHRPAFLTASDLLRGVNRIAQNVRGADEAA